MKKVVFFSAVLIGVGTYSTAQANLCVNIFANNGERSAQPTWTMFQERDEFQGSLKSLVNGSLAASNFKATPPDREVAIYVSSNSSTLLYVGRIRWVQHGANGELEIVFSRKDDNGNYGQKDEVIPISRIQAESASIKKVVGEIEKQGIVAKFDAAISSGQYVSFIFQYVYLRSVKGLVVRFQRNKTGQITGFVLAEDNGHEVRYPISDVDPTSIKLFNVKPRSLNAGESLLESQMKAAISDGKYVSFLAKSKTVRYEGWVTDLHLGTDGEYIFKFDENKYEPGRGSLTLRLSDISVDSFVEKPSLKVREPVAVENNGHAAARVDGYLENTRNGSIQEVKISNNLYSELSVFADSTQVSGQRLPRELEDLVQPGSEMRLYFTGGKRCIRLTIRRGSDGSWSFGNTIFDRMAVNESYVDNHSNSRYTFNESDHLVSNHYVYRLPAAMLRYHLTLIRDGISREQVTDQFQSIHSQWVESIPEDATRSEIMDLLIHSEGVSYHLNRGFVKEQLAPLAETQIKILAAIRYLVANNLVFWSYNAGASKINEGIYPRDSVNPTNMWLMDYNFESALFRSMKNAGLEYVNGEWVKKLQPVTAAP